MLLKCYAQYASKFGKLSRGHRTGKDQFSFQSQRRAMPKNVQSTTQLHSFHMLARLCSKFFKLGFSSTWTENFQRYKLGLEKAEERKINCQHTLDHRKSKGIPEKTSTSASLTTLKPFDCVDNNKLWKILQDVGIPDHLIYLLRNLYAGQDATIELTWNNRLVQNWKRSMSRLYTVTLLI